MDFALTLCEEIRNLIKDGLPENNPFKEHFIGDPLFIGQSFLPCICYVLNSSSYPGEAPTGTEEVITSITIRVVFNKKNEFGKSSKDVTLQQTMQNIIEGRDATTKKLISNTILGILREKYTLQGKAIRQISEVNYRPNLDRPDEITLEGEINLTLDERFILDNRT